MSVDYHHAFPFIRTPILDMFGGLFTRQDDPRCADFEMKYVECITAYGHSANNQRCLDYYDDLRECDHHEKSIKRYMAMQAERRRLYKEGKLSKEEAYPLRARLDGY